MDKKLFQETYTPIMLELIGRYSEMLQLEIKNSIASDNHHVILKAKHKVEELATCRMIISANIGCF